MPKLRLTDAQIAARCQLLEIAANFVGGLHLAIDAQIQQQQQAEDQIRAEAIRWADEQLSREPLIV